MHSYETQRKIGEALRRMKMSLFAQQFCVCRFWAINQVLPGDVCRARQFDLAFMCLEIAQSKGGDMLIT
jgi:hypothetical protein